VRWFLDRFKGRNRSRAPLVCYLRENGPIAYGAELFGQDPRERADAMFATGLSWFWKAAGPAAIARDWTSLTRWSLAALLADLAIEQGGARPDILVIGIEVESFSGVAQRTSLIAQPGVRHGAADICFSQGRIGFDGLGKTAVRLLVLSALQLLRADIEQSFGLAARAARRRNDQ